MDIHQLYDQLAEGRAVFEFAKDTPAPGYRAWISRARVTIQDLRNNKIIAIVCPGLVEVPHPRVAEARSLGIPVGVECDEWNDHCIYETLTPARAWDYLGAKVAEGATAQWAGYQLRRPISGAGIEIWRVTARLQTLLAVVGPHLVAARRERARELGLPARAMGSILRNRGGAT